MSGDEEMRGVLERIIFANEDTHYCVGEFQLDGAESAKVTITGKLPGVQCGETLKLSGYWKTHPQHGRQFNISAFKAELPSSVHGIRKYLGSGLVPGIGKVYAEKIVDCFGEETLRVISEESGRLREVPGIGKQRAQSIKVAWDDQVALREVMVFLKTYGVGTAQCLRLVKHYGNQAQTVLREDPYRIAREIEYIGFKTADKIALNLGFSNECVARIEAGILFALSELEGEGHTCADPDVLKDRATELLEVNPPMVVDGLDRLLQDGHLVEERGRIQSTPLKRAEDMIARCLHGLSKWKSALPQIQIDKAVEWSQQQAGFEFAEEQCAGVRGALMNKLAVITGGPGTGKTTILRALVSILKAKKVKVVMAAPTGRAAQRMAEATGGYAQTIHRLLDFDPSAGQFRHNEDHPLNAEFVIVDETSMLDARLAASLFRAVPYGAHLLLVGDTNQLPSVGPGDVLGDLIRSRLFHVTRLERIFRQGSRSHIVSTAHSILSGDARPPRSVTPDEIDFQTDMHFVRSEDADECHEKVVSLCADLGKRLKLNHPVMDIQVLAPMHKSVVGVSALNEALQSALNPNKTGIAFGDSKYRVGDKVIQMRNNYDKNIFNGDIGLIEDIDVTNGIVSVKFDTGLVGLERMDLVNLQLAYAISIHKSQGSEFPVVVVPLMKQHFIMLQRNLVYTAITRGRRKVVIVGDPAAYAMAVNNSESMERVTGLVEKLKL